MLQIYNYNAGKGDCIRLRYTGTSGVSRNIMIDSGVTRFASRFSSVCSEIAASGETVDVLVLTHADIDHIGGLLGSLRCGRKLPVMEVWMNHGTIMPSHVDLSVRQNDEVYTRLVKSGMPLSPAVAGNTYELDGAVFRILWPTEELLESTFKLRRPVPLGVSSDYGYSFKELMDMPIRYSDASCNNRASIVFEFEYAGLRFLFTGDAWSADILANIRNGTYDLVKLPHHGSVRNLSEGWNNRIRCSNYMICTDGICHPDKQTIAKLLKWNGKINVYGSVDWWDRLLLGEDRQCEVHFIEGEKIIWNIPMQN